MIYGIHQNKIRKSRFSKVAAFWALGIIGNGSYLAGGALRTLIDNQEEVSDFDVFFQDINRPELPEIPYSLELNIDFSDPPLATEVKEEPIFDHPARVAEVKKILEREKFKLVFECEKGELFSYKKGDMKVQLICVKFLDPAEMIQTFDFGACQAAFDGENFFYSKAFIRNIQTKRLSTEFVEFPAATINRLIKYKSKGYNVSGAIVDFMEKISGMSFDGNSLRLYVD